MHVNTALEALAHKSMNISTHIISCGLRSMYVKEKRRCLGNGDPKLTGCIAKEIV